MQLPNKLYSYSNSTLALMPIILNKLKNGPIELNELFLMIKPLLIDSVDFFTVMDCLYALRAININERNEVFLCL